MSQRNFKKCFITGITGSGGSYLAEYIAKNVKGTKIIGSFRGKKNLKLIDRKVRKKIFISKLRLDNFEGIKKFLNKNKPDLIFHLASNADVRSSFDFPGKIIKDNTIITLNLLEAVKQLNYKPLIIMCSTSEVYGLVKKKDIPISENQKFNPASPYAFSKVFQDYLAQMYLKVYDQKIIITRMFSYVNPKRVNLFQTSFADQIAKLEKSKKKRRILSHGNLDSIRTFIDIKDAMKAYWTVAVKGKIGEIYNIGGKNVVSVRSVLKTLIKKSKVKIITKTDNSLLRPIDITLQIPKVKKFINDTKWKPSVSLDEALGELLNYRRKINEKKK